MNLKKTFIDVKIFMARAQSYVSIVNSGMILFLFLSKLKEAGYIKMELDKLIILLFLLSLVGMALFGFIEDKLKLHHEEMRRVQDRNPYMQDIISRLESIERRLEKNDNL